MTVQRVEQHLRGAEQSELQVPLADIYSGGDYAAGSALAEIALKNLGLPTRNFLLRGGDGYYQMAWWQLSYNGWEYPEPQETDIDQEEMVIFGVARSSHDAFNEARILAAHSTDGLLPFEADNALFGVTITRDATLRLAAVNDVDATVTYYADTGAKSESSAYHHKGSNALGINEEFLAGLTPEQASKYIKAAYRSLSTMFHPDIGEEDRSIMQQINTDNARLLKKYGISSSNP